MSTNPVELGMLAASEREALQQQLVEYRLTRLPERLARADATVERLADYRWLRPTMATLRRWYSDVEGHGPIPEWSLMYALQRIAYPPRDPQARRAAASNLATWVVLCASREQRRPLEPLPTWSDDAGRLLDLRRTCFIELGRPPGARLRWELDGDRLVARSAGEPEPSPVVSSSELDAARRPAPRSAFGLSVFEDPWSLGSDRDGGSPSPSTLPLLRSLDEAHQILSGCMPQALAWIEALIPAFVSLGPPPSPGANRSETHEAGGPLFLGLVDDPMRHAEAVVHETQHQRYRLFERSQPFRSATDRQCRYISPWRKDLRPMRGIQLGLHAFVAVNDLRLRARERDLVPDDERLVRNALQSHYANLFAFRTIVEHDPPTEAGEHYLQTMARVLRSQHPRITRFERPGDDRLLDAYFARHCGSEGLAAAVDARPELRDWPATLRLIDRLSS